MADKNQEYQFPWGFHLGDLHKEDTTIPLFTPSDDGGFCLLYDKASERKADNLLESLSLLLLSTMPHGSLKVKMFDPGKKKFYHLSPLKFIELYENAFDSNLMSRLFENLEKTIISRYKDLLCCNRQTIDEHNQKSKLKQEYHLALINLENFPTEDISLKRIQNFVESAQKAGVYVIAFANQEIENSHNETTKVFLDTFKKIRVENNDFAITKEVFEFTELLEDHTFKALHLEKDTLMQEVLTNADLEKMFDAQTIQSEANKNRSS